MEDGNSVALLKGVSDCLADFAGHFDLRIAAEQLLTTALTHIGAEFGYVGEVLYDGAGNPYLKTFALTNIAWDDATRRLYEESATSGLEFRNLKTLFGVGLLSAKPVISNEPSMDPRRGGLPHGHPPLNSFLALPILRGGTLIGQIGFGNRGGGFDQKVLDALKPISSTFAVMIEGSRADTRRKASELDLIRTDHHLKQATALQSQFVSMASHEFRNPLSIILSSTELLERYSQKFNEPKLKTHFERIRTSIAHMQAILEDVLVLGKAESGTLQFNPEPIDLAAVTHLVFQSLPSGRERCHLRITGEYEPALLDAKLMHQIIENLVSNALKYSAEDSGVCVELVFSGCNVAVSVEDKGVGIPPEDIKKIFEPFVRARNAPDFSGTGLGLAVVRACVARQNGTIQIDSTLGAGTRICATFPCTTR